MIQDQLGQLGIQVNVEGMETGALITQKAYPQTFDAMILGATWDTPEPQVLTNLLLNSQLDVVGGGFNFASYVNPEVDALLAQAGANVDCSAATRAPIYKQIQETVHNDVAYDFISDLVGYTVFSNKIGNVVPGNWGFNQVQDWTVGSKYRRSRRFSLKANCAVGAELSSAPRDLRYNHFCRSLAIRHERVYTRHCIMRMFPVNSSERRHHHYLITDV